MGFLYQKLLSASVKLLLLDAGERHSLCHCILVILTIYTQTSRANQLSPSDFPTGPSLELLTCMDADNCIKSWALKGLRPGKSPALFWVTANSQNSKTVSNKRNVTKWSEFLTTPVSDCSYSDKSSFHYPIQMTHPRKWLISESLSFPEATLAHLFVQESSFCEWRPSMLKT